MGSGVEPDACCDAYHRPLFLKRRTGSLSCDAFPRNPQKVTARGHKKLILGSGVERLFVEPLETCKSSGYRLSPTASANSGFHKGPTMLVCKDLFPPDFATTQVL